MKSTYLLKKEKIYIIEFMQKIIQYKPHIHIYYGEYEASIGLDGELLGGSLPVKKLKLVQAWIILHEDELYEAWDKAVKGQQFDEIEPLK